MREYLFQYAFSSENNLPSSKVYYLLISGRSDVHSTHNFLMFYFLLLLHNGIRIANKPNLLFFLPFPLTTSRDPVCHVSLVQRH